MLNFLGLGFVLKKVFNAIFSRKRIIAWISAVILAIVALASGISVEELKAGIADAPKIELGTTTSVESTESK